MSTTLFKRPALVGLAGILALMSFVPTAEAQYRRPNYYGRRRGGWRNVYLAAIIVPIVIFAVILLFWFLVFRKILARRRQRHAEVLPSHNSSATYPQTGDYSGSNPYAGGYDPSNNNTYNYGQQQDMSQTQYPQQAHVGGQQQYAPPPGKPPQSGY